MKKAITVLFILIFLAAMIPITALADPDEEYYDNDVDELTEELTEEVGAESMTPPSRVIVVGYTVGGGGLAAGEISNVAIKLRNTSDNYYVNSVLLTGWIESGAPIEFSTTNQEYGGRIAPDEETIVTFTYYTQNVDLTAIASVTVGFTINYGDEATNVERVSNVSINLPVLRGLRTSVEDADMIWATYYPSRINVILSSGGMQAVYVGLLVASLLLSVILILFKVGIFVRK
ncbi:MAG: hypothetical protein FWD05_06765 [Oscillospiraceae bacterium]|nr:hypothetical protein [Oscillospiraceae bacterium]